MASVIHYSPHLERRKFRRKQVRFADTHPKSGVEFKTIKIITPNNSAENLFLVPYTHTAKALKPLVFNNTRCLFALEKNIMTIVKRAIKNMVCLENILCSQFAVLGLIRVKNIAFNKKVTVRYTMNGWETYRDIWADYVSSSADKSTDKFTFRIPTFSWLFEDKCDIEFALCYRVNGVEYWDNYDDENYRISCTKSFRF